MHTLTRPECSVPQTALALTALSFGAATFGTDYNDDTTSLPVLDAARRALELGINSFDTSPYYTTSETLLGNALQHLSDEGRWVRDTYYLCTKVGRYGAARSDFDYSRDRIRCSIEESMRKLHPIAAGTESNHKRWLDVVYVHDVEFVAEDPSETRTHLKGSSPTETISEHDLLHHDIDDILIGSGDYKVLVAIDEVFAAKREGLVKYVGISGYPLQTLFRIAYLALLMAERRAQTITNATLGGHCQRAMLSYLSGIDAILSYAQYTPQSTRLSQYAPKLHRLAKVPYIINASPLSMGLLTTTGPRNWHPAPSLLREVAMQAARRVVEQRHERCDPSVSDYNYWGGKNISIAQASLAYSLGLREFLNASTPEADFFQLRRLIRTTVMGFSSVSEVEEAVAVWRMVQRAHAQSRPQSPRLKVSSRRKSISTGLENGTHRQPQLSRSTSYESLSSLGVSELSSPKEPGVSLSTTLDGKGTDSVNTSHLIDDDQVNLSGSVLQVANTLKDILSELPQRTSSEDDLDFPLSESGLWELNQGADPDIRALLEASRKVERTFMEAGWKDWSWPSPSQKVLTSS